MSRQGERAEMIDHEQRLGYWVRQLADSSPAEFLIDRPRPAQLSGIAGSVPLAIDGVLHKDLQSFCYAQHTTPFVILLAALRAAHYRLTGSEDASIGTSTSGFEEVGLGKKTSCSTDTQCLRITIQDIDTFEDVIHQVQATTTAAQANHGVSFEQICSAIQSERKTVSRSPLVHVALFLHPRAETKMQQNTLTRVSMPIVETTVFDVELHLFQEPDKISGHLVFARELFEDTTIQNLHSVFQEILGRSLERPRVSISTLPLVDGVDQLQRLGLLKVQHTDYPRDSSIIEVFHEQLIAHPDRIAVKDSTTLLTYAELDRQSDKLACWLRQRDLPAESLVGVLAPRSCETIVGFLGILKANLAYLPLDVNVPTARLEVILSAFSGEKLVLLGANIQASELKTIKAQLVPIGDTLAEDTGLKSTVKTGQPSARSLAYVVFTSGSTGKPKGVMIEHRGVVRLVKCNNYLNDLPPRPRIAHLSNIGFDASIWEISSALLNGGTLVCVDYSVLLDLRKLEALFIQDKVQVAMFTPAILKIILASAPSIIRLLNTVVIAGDRLDSSDATRAHALSKSSAYNLYGPSENTVASTAWNITEKELFMNGAPIGRSISNSGAYVMDSQQNLVSMGVIGELVVTGDGLARGYTDPALNFNRFVKLNIDGKPVAAYRTGDRVRWRPIDGLIEFFGRMDDQIKIRGYRIELGEVEHAIRKGVNIRDVAIVARSTSDNDREIVGFVTMKEDQKTAYVEASGQVHEVGNRVRQQLQDLLPAYMVPAQIVVLEYLPLNANGKVDRKELTRQAEAARAAVQSSNIYTAPSNEIEAAICEELTAILGMDVGSSDNFFELGGHSLIATKLAARISRRMDAYVSVEDIFYNPVLANLAKTIRKGSASYSQIPSTGYTDPVEQSYAQGRLWFLDQLHRQASWYLIPLATRLRGPLNTEALNIALGALVQRHETLRTTFEEHDGIGFQVVHAYSTSELKIVDVSSSDEAVDSYRDVLRREQTRPFDLKSETGLRVLLLRLGQDHHILSIVMHHIISDGWSVDVLRRELRQFYAAALRGQNPLSTIARLPIQYRDFSIWQKRDRDQATEHNRQLVYWTQQLADNSPAELLADRPRPSQLSGQAGVVQLTIDGALYKKVQTFSRVQRTTPFVVLLTAFRATHFRLTGCEDATISTPIANRNRPELEDMIGFFVNTQCIRTTVSGNDTFEDLVCQVRTTTTQAHSNQDVPFERIVSAMSSGSRDTSKNPLVQLDFAFHSQPGLRELQLDGIKGEIIQEAVTTRTDIEFHIYQGMEKLDGEVLYSTELFELETIQNMVDVFQEVLRRGLEQPQTLIRTLPLTDGLCQLSSLGLLEVKRTGFPRDLSIVDAFREQVAAVPHLVAVKDTSSQLTYAELDQQSEALGRWLRQRNVAAEALVAVLAPRSYQAIISFLGILKANLAYLPLDINAPIARMKTILSGISGDKIVLLGTGMPHLDLQLTDIELVQISDILSQPIPSGYADAILPSPKSLAYVIFTSGSTGKPKGVMLEHRGVIRLVKSSPYVQKLPQAPRVAHLSNLAFDVSTWEIYTALLTGGTLICVDHDTILDTSALKDLFAREQIQAASLTPALLKLCLANAPALLTPLDILCIGGDRLDPNDARKAQTLVRGSVYNAYGPTENTVDSVLYEITDNDLLTNGTPIGRAISDSGAYIMNSQQEMVSIGVIGELVVTGDGVARGYTDPTLNVDRFVEVEINGKLTRAYRTGDRARWRPTDGLIECFGRIDQQVKIRGHRIELSEVEHVILSDARIHDAAVVVRSTEVQEPEMVGFVTLRTVDGSFPDGAGNQIDTWGNHFEGSIYTDLDKISHHEVGTDFVGWTSMYDGKPINKAEMREWLDDTVQTLLNGEAAGHVLEIGTGTGMMLFNLGDGLRSYVGLEPSRTVAEFVNKTIDSTPALADIARVHVGVATDVSQIKGLRPDVVILNSVVQYFPSSKYLIEVFNTLSRIPSVRHIFFGDVRSYALNDEFLASRVLRTLGDDATRIEVRLKMAEIAARDEELLVDPAFFTELAGRFPGRVRHVEILPKIMQATNELSAYRYAAVVHLKGIEEMAQPIHEIKTDAWIDFEAASMNQDALLQCLQSLPPTSVLALANIPNRKVSLEKHIIQSLSRDEDNSEGSERSVARVSAAREKAECCTALSAWDLVQIGMQVGFCVELSWARQRSNKGALDAIFHRFQPISRDSRVMFQFQMEDRGGKLESLTTQPLDGLQARQLGSLTRKRLQDLLPAYMVPSQIIVLEEMPMNANGKTDRQKLEHRAQVLPKVLQSSRLRVAPHSELEKALCEELGTILGVDVSLSDNFFELGGHSLMATMLATRVSRRMSTHLSVKDVFDYPILADLAKHIRTNGSANHARTGQPERPQKLTPLQSLPMNDPDGFVRDFIIPQIKEHHSSMALDVYPTTHTQKTYLEDPLTGHPRPPVPFFVDFPSDADVDSLRRACAALIQHFDIFRTVFLHVSGQFYQVVLDSLPVAAPMINVEGDIRDATMAIMEEDKLHPLSLGRSLLRMTILRKSGCPVRLVLRISHALYDGLSFETLIPSLHALYAGQSLPEAPRFAQYISRMVDSREAGYQYWRSFLRDSSLTVIPWTPQQRPNHDGVWHMHKSISTHVPLRSHHDITQATVFTGACALTLAKSFDLREVVFGRDVSGRQYLPVDSQHIVGPCTNTVPVRLRIDEEKSPLTLLREIQSQYLDCLPFETLGLDDIRENCTDWPETVTQYGCCSAYHNFDLYPTSVIQNQQIQLGDLSWEAFMGRSPIYGVEMEAYASPNQHDLHIFLQIERKLCDEQRAKCILDDLCGHFAVLNAALQKPHGDSRHLGGAMGP